MWLLLAQLQLQRLRAPQRPLPTAAASVHLGVRYQVGWDIETAGNGIGLVRVGHSATQAIAVQGCRIHTEPLMQPYAYVIEGSA